MSGASCIVAGQSPATVYKIVDAASWISARASGRYLGSRDDDRDGFIHLSTRAQLRGTLDKHFAGQADLVLVALDARRLGKALRYEASRGGDLFPHLYAPLDLSTVLGEWPLPLGADGRHVIAEEIA